MVLSIESLSLMLSRKSLQLSGTFYFQNFPGSTPPLKGFIQWDIGCEFCWIFVRHGPWKNLITLTLNLRWLQSLSLRRCILLCPNQIRLVLHLYGLLQISHFLQPTRVFLRPNCSHIPLLIRYCYRGMGLWPKSWHLALIFIKNLVLYNLHVRSYCQIFVSDRLWHPRGLCVLVNYI